MDNKSNIFEQQKNVKEIEEIIKDSKLWDSIDSVANSIVESRNSEAAMVFTEHIGKLLRDNGVNVKGAIYYEPPLNDDLPNVARRYCSDIEGIDFSEHDKQFLKEKCFLESKIRQLESENKELRQQLEEIDLVGNLPYEPIEVAQMLITATHTYKTNGLQKALGAGETSTYNIYDVSDLRQIAEHLLVYCNNKDKE